MYQTSQREDTRYDIFGPLVEDAIYVHGSDVLVVATQMTRCRDHSEHMLVVLGDSVTFVALRDMRKIDIFFRLFEKRECFARST